MAIKSIEVFMLGSYDIPFRIVDGEISLPVEREGENLIYRRECAGKKGGESTYRKR